jgi:nucleoside-diphosphate-sugar epimerase
MKILVSGGAGFLGSVLVPMLLERVWWNGGNGENTHVTVVDNFRHGVPSLLSSCRSKLLTVVNHDVRMPMQEFTKNVDAIIHLAGLVGAPLCERDPTAAITINHRATVDLVKQLSPEQILIYPNTNSGYGVGGEGECTEESPLKPISMYGRTKCLGEEAVMEHRNATSFRFATLFGCSPRMRLDLLVNDFVHRAVTDRCLTLFEGGFRRNYLHVADAANTILWALSRRFMAGQVYNAGLSSANLNKRQLCETIQQFVKGFVWHEAPVGEDPDKRDYVVSNAKLEATGWRPAYTLDDGIRELVKAYSCPMQLHYRN